MTSMRIGESAPRGDAAAKATGREHYAADAYPENLIWAQAARPGVPCGRIVKVDTRAALAVPGVLKVLLAKDVSGSNRQGIIHKDMPVLVEDRVRCCGEAVALVLAETRAAATLAASRVAVDIEPLAGVFDPETAMAPGAPLVHDDRAGNLLAQAVIRKGLGADAFSACDVVVESVFTTPVQAHAFLETESGIARLQDDGDLLMEVSTQSPFRDRFEIGHALGMAFERIHIVAPSLGGGFGGKDGATVQCLLGLAALHAEGRPVKITWDREESFAAGYKRHACHLHYRLGAHRDGTLQSSARFGQGLFHRFSACHFFLWRPSGPHRNRHPDRRRPGGGLPGGH